VLRGSHKDAYDRAPHHDSGPEADLYLEGHDQHRGWFNTSLLSSMVTNGVPPFKALVTHGFVNDSQGFKMSKSKGNVLIPEILLEAHGSDIIRYWCASSKLGTDTAYSEDVINNGKRLVNKLWNAAKFASTHFDKISDSDKALSLCEVKHKITRDFDKYLVNQVVDLVDYADQELTNYEYATAIDKTEKFFWALFCDNYLEITKTRAYNENGEDDEGALSTHLTLYHTLKTLLQLFAPILPHITEELFHILYAKDNSESIHMRGSWPNVREAKFTDIDETKSEDLLEVLELVRKIKAQDNLSIKSPISYIEIEGIMLPDNLISDLKNVTSAKEILYVEQLTSQNQNLQGKNLQNNVVY
jgi:valyl-tRNA synthetase